MTDVELGTTHNTCFSATVVNILQRSPEYTEFGISIAGRKFVAILNTESPCKHIREWSGLRNIQFP
jgi:hypothetical protein